MIKLIGWGLLLVMCCIFPPLAILVIIIAVLKMAGVI